MESVGQYYSEDQVSWNKPPVSGGHPLKCHRELGGCLLQAGGHGLELLRRV